MKRKTIKLILMNFALAAGLLAILITAFFVYGIKMPGESYAGSLSELSPVQRDLHDRLNEHVKVLAGEIGERNAGKRQALEDAADYIDQQFRSMEYVPRSEVINSQGFRNIVVDLYGKQSRERILVVGAHYDTAPSTPGADDNASGVAALLEIARSFRTLQLPITVRFVAFVNEEFPFYGTENMGSLYHAQQAKEKQENISGMFSLEMLGFYSDQYRSQYYPRIIRRFYPRTGNFIAFVSNIMSRPLLADSISSFRSNVDFPSQGLAAPQWLVRGIRRSDHASFWVNGYQAVMVTDTANYRNYGYHNLGDTHNTLDYKRMTLVVDGLTRMLSELAQEY